MRGENLQLSHHPQCQRQARSRRNPRNHNRCPSINPQVHQPVHTTEQHLQPDWARRCPLTLSAHLQSARSLRPLSSQASSTREPTPQLRISIRPKLQFSASPPNLYWQRLLEEHIQALHLAWELLQHDPYRQHPQHSMAEALEPIMALSMRDLAVARYPMITLRSLRGILPAHLHYRRVHAVEQVR